MTNLPWEPKYGFTHTDPTQLASALEVVRRRICAYGPYATTCDCKYGVGQALTVTPPPASATSAFSEMTGCPELRSAIRMLLHPEDCDGLVGWVGVLIEAEQEEPGSVRAALDITP